jgi:hypothetical protein
MAFNARCEYYRLSSDGVGTVILDQAAADAEEHSAGDVTAADLPATTGSYAMCVTVLSGAVTVEVGVTPVGTPERGKLILEGNHDWFLIKKDYKVTVLEYTVA